MIHYMFNEPDETYTKYVSGLTVEDAVKEAEALFRRLKRRRLTQFAVTVELPPLDGVRRRIYQLNRYQKKIERINRVGLAPFEWEPFNEADQLTPDELPMPRGPRRSVRRSHHSGGPK